MVGTAAEFADLGRQGLLDLVIAEVRKALYYTQRPDRLMFGSDWPLAPMSTYRDFIGQLVPEEYHQLVFRENATSLYGLGEPGGRAGFQVPANVKENGKRGSDI